MPKLARRKRSNEIKLTFNVIALISGFVFSWTPYAFVSMWCAFKDCNDIPPLLHSYLAIFAKSSMIWAPVLFLFANQNMILNLRKSFRISRNSQRNCSVNRRFGSTRFHSSSNTGKETFPHTDLDNINNSYESHNVIQREKSSEEFHLYGKRINKDGLQETFV